METTITIGELSKRLSDVLHRVENRGERFLVQSNGVTVAAIIPAAERSGTTWEEFTARVRDLEFPGKGFADDLEAVQAEQGLAARYREG